MRQTEVNLVANEDTLLRTLMFPRLPPRATFVAYTKFVSETRKMFALRLCCSTLLIRWSSEAAILAIQPVIFESL